MDFEKLKAAIEANDLETAQRMLDEAQEKSAEWHYLCSVVDYKRGWYLDCKKQLQKAMDKDPLKEKYKDAYEKLISMANRHREAQEAEIKEKGRMGVCEICTFGLCGGVLRF